MSDLHEHAHEATHEDGNDEREEEESIAFNIVKPYRLSL